MNSLTPSLQNLTVLSSVRIENDSSDAIRFGQGSHPLCDCLLRRGLSLPSAYADAGFPMHFLTGPNNLPLVSISGVFNMV